jgi:hypothetical protein
MTEPRNQSSANNREQGKSNDDAISYSNRHACVSMGKVHKPGDVTSAFCVETADGKHNFFMDADGQRKGWTTSTSPGVFQVECGEHPDVEDVDEKEALDSLVFICKNGNTVIRNKNGKIRLEGTDIELIATGEGSNKGNIRLITSETVEIKCKKLNVDAKCLIKLSSPGVVECSANACMKIYASIIRGVTDACKVKDSKVGGKKIVEANNKTV